METSTHTAPPVDLDRLVQRWLEDHDADDACGVLRLHARHLRPIVAARCSKRPRKVLLLASRECDPCVCGDASGWHPECYWWFVQDHGGDVTKAPAAIEKNALPWRIRISSLNDQVEARDQ